MSAHTRGPWTARGNCVDTGGDYAIRCDRTGANGSQDVANARLIAAAPELYAALDALLTFHEPDSQADQCTDARLREQCADAWDKARAVLASVTP